MDSTVKPEATGAHDLLLVRGDDKPTSDYEKVVREELARVQERLAKLASARAAEPPKSEIAPVALDPKMLDPKLTTFRAAAAGNVDVSGQSHSLRRAMMSGVTALALALGAAGAAVAWQSPYADTPKAMIAHWAPQIASLLSLPLNKAAPTESAPAPVQTAAAADTAPSTPPAPVQSPAQDAAPAAAPPQDSATAAPPVATAPPGPDVPQLLQSMAHDLASLEQGMEQLKANQEQLTRDNAKLAEQLKVNQEQMARLIAHEPVVRSRVAPRPAAAAVRRPVARSLPSPHPVAPAHAAAAMPPPPPMQLQTEEPDLPTAPRPPRAVP